MTVINIPHVLEARGKVELVKQICGRYIEDISHISKGVITMPEILKIHWIRLMAY